VSGAVLVTGGTGFIGSHVAVDLIEHGRNVVLIDNLANSSSVVVDRIAAVTGERPVFEQVDVTDRRALTSVIDHHSPAAVVHCAGLKAVGESVSEPLRYYTTNIGGTLSLLAAMEQVGVRHLVFSSSATVYGDPIRLPIDEDHPIAPTNPYGRTKAHVERMLADLAAADDRWRIIALRYFNPVGAHHSGQLGEDPRAGANNLMPRVLDVASGKGQAITVWGDDWDTPDGTGVRDYLHVMDLAAGHRAALDELSAVGPYQAINLGTGTGYSVLDVISAVRAVSGRPVPLRLEPRRPGDIASCRADPSRAKELLGWQADRTLADMCRDAWQWCSANPHGYPPAQTQP